MPITLGCVISRFENVAETDEVRRRDLGRVVHLDRANNRFYVIPFPEKSGNRREGRIEGERRRHHIKRPWMGCISEFEALEEDTYKFPRWSVPAIHLLTDAEMLENASNGELRKTRRDLRRSIEVRDAHYAMIQPIVADAAVEQLLDPNWLKERTEARARELGLRSGTALIRHVRQYLLGGSKPNALLPRYDLINVRGREKEPRIRDGKLPPKAGARNRLTKAGFKGREGRALTRSARDHLRNGWKRFKVKEGLSVYSAYLLTLKHYFPGSVGRTETGALWTEEEAAMLPTECQFRTHGPNRRPELSASRANMSPLAYEKNHRPRVGSNRDELLGVGFAAIDATSCDQNLVSVGDPTMLVLSPWETKVVERYTGYIIGWHCGFEPRSHVTSLMAVDHAASDKVEFCRRYGVEIEPGKWLSLVISALKSDNGETKSVEAIAALAGSGISLEFVSPYRSDRNGEVETIHNSLARAGSHLVAGSTLGRRRKRGDPDPIENACINFGQYMPLQIKAILKHNNEELVPHLLPMEAMREGIRPTRGAILKWMIDNGHVMSAVSELPEVHTRCLPRLKATIERGMVYLKDYRDKRCSRQRRIPFLRYKPCPTPSQQLVTFERNRDCQVFINPSYAGEAWLYADGLIRLQLQSNDEELHRATLSEWLDITDVIGIEREEERLRGAYKEALRLSEILEVCRKGRKAVRDAEREKAGRPPKSKLRANRRENTRIERERQQAQLLGTEEPLEAADANAAQLADGSDPGSAAIASPPAAPAARADRPVGAALQAHRNSHRPVL